MTDAAKLNTLGYIEITEDTPREPCSKCGKLLAFGHESTYRLHECPKWYL